MSRNGIPRVEAYNGIIPLHLALAHSPHGLEPMSRNLNGRDSTTVELAPFRLRRNLMKFPPLAVIKFLPLRTLRVIGSGLLNDIRKPDPQGIRFSYVAQIGLEPMTLRV